MAICIKIVLPSFIDFHISDSRVLRTANFNFPLVSVPLNPLSLSMQTNSSLIADRGCVCFLPWSSGRSSVAVAGGRGPVALPPACLRARARWSALQPPPPPRSGLSPVVVQWRACVLLAVALLQVVAPGLPGSSSSALPPWLGACVLSLASREKIYKKVEKKLRKNLHMSLIISNFVARTEIKSTNL